MKGKDEMNEEINNTLEEKDELNEEIKNTPEEAEEKNNVTAETEETAVSSGNEDKNNKKTKDRCRWLAYCFIASFAAKLRSALFMLLCSFGFLLSGIETTITIMAISCGYFCAANIFVYVAFVLEIAFVISDIVKLKKEGIRITGWMWVCILFTPFYLLARNKNKKVRSFYKIACIIFWVLDIFVSVVSIFIEGIFLLFFFLRISGSITVG